MILFAWALFAICTPQRQCDTNTSTVDRYGHACMDGCLGERDHYMGVMLVFFMSAQWRKDGSCLMERSVFSLR